MSTETMDGRDPSDQVSCSADFEPLSMICVGSADCNGASLEAAKDCRGLPRAAKLLLSSCLEAADGCHEDFVMASVVFVKASVCVCEDLQASLM